MRERGRFMDDLAGVAQGALSAFTGLRDEAEAVFAARVEAVIHKLDIARGEQLAAVQEMAAKARLAQEAAEAELAALKARVAALEAKLGTVAPAPGVDPLTAVPVDVPAPSPSDPMPGAPQDPPVGAAGGAAPASPIA
ncbi:accessory factor UbiK family protein [Acidisoma sp. 7E03]